MSNRSDNSPSLVGGHHSGLNNASLGLNNGRFKIKNNNSRQSSGDNAFQFEENNLIFDTLNKANDSNKIGGEVKIEPPRLAIVNLLDFDVKQQH